MYVRIAAKKGKLSALICIINPHLRVFAIFE